MSTENKPLLSYYMRNGLWYFTQPPDAVRGQVIPRSTVESWLSRVEEMEADRAKTREVVQRLVDAGTHEGACDKFVPHMDGSIAYFDDDIPCSCGWEDAISIAKTELGIEPTPEKP